VGVSLRSAQSAEDVVGELGTDAERGLPVAEAARRLAADGPNLLPSTAPDSRFVRLLRQLSNPLVVVLLVAGAVTLALGEYVDAVVVLGVVLANTVVGYVQEARAQSALRALQDLVSTDARVVRDGATRSVPSADLVVGDLVLVEAGDAVPADGRLLRSRELRVDESALTGESAPVAKDPAVLAVGTAAADQRNTVFAGSLVTAGAGACVVTATGADTELGGIDGLVSGVVSLETPLTRQLGRFSGILTVVILGLAAATSVVGVLRGLDAGEVVTSAVALAVGAIPEGLPAAVTVTLAIGAARMAKRRAVVRQLPAVETLGSTTVICTDKTGTLTENQMTVRVVWTCAGDHEVTGSGYAPTGDVLDPAGTVLLGTAVPEALRWTLLAGAACNDAVLRRRPDGGGTEVVGDPTEGALLVSAGKAGIDTEDFPRVDVVLFSSGRRYMATLHDHGDHRVVLAKGGVEAVLALCGSQLGPDGDRVPLDVAGIARESDRLAAAGLRVLATAALTVDADHRLAEVDLPETLVFTGLQAMLDPPRASAVHAVTSCRTAGIRVVMITGDHAATATAIAVQVGILRARSDGDVLTGADLTALTASSPTAFDGAVGRAAVFARVSPEQKLRLVQSLQDAGAVVAMTGDGVNDAPALRQADIGVAMGRGGTEVAKEAADVVLADDDFGTVEAAVEEGRGVFDNISKFIVWTLPTNAAEGLVILVAIVLGTALPILPTQILWINMTTAVLLGLTLAFEPHGADTMTRPPRRPGTPLLTASLVSRVLLVSAVLVAGTWYLFQQQVDAGATLPEARTAAMDLFVAVQVLYLFSCRSLVGPSWRVGLLTNRWLVGGVLLQVVAQLAITYLPAMNDLFQTAPVDAGTWLRIAVLATVAWAVVAVDEHVRGRRRADRGPNGVRVGTSDPPGPAARPAASST
jgi:cation-transporting ATPase F